MLEKIKIGYYSSANGIAGTEIYLRAVLLNLDYKRYKVTFFCTDEHPLRYTCQIRLKSITR